MLPQKVVWKWKSRSTKRFQSFKSNAITNDMIPNLNKEGMANPSYSMWKVDLDVAIVLMITLMWYLTCKHIIQPLKA